MFLDDLSAMVPRVKRQMDTSDYVRRPIVMVFSSSVVKDERSVISAVGLFDKLANFAYKNGACLKFFDQEDPSSDAKLLSKGSGDFLVAIGQNSLSHTLRLERTRSHTAIVAETSAVELKARYRVV